MYAVCAGILLAVSLLTWIGSPIFIGLIAIYMLIQFTSDIKENKSSEHTTIISSVTLLVTLILIIPFVVKEVRPGLEMSPMFLSWFQVSFVTFVIISVFTLSFISSFVKTKKNCMVVLSFIHIHTCNNWNISDQDNFSVTILLINFRIHIFEWRWRNTWNHLRGSTSIF